MEALTESPSGHCPPPRPRPRRKISKLRTDRRVLIIEDNWLLALDAERALTRAGYRVTGIHATARDGIASAKAARPDLALVDIRIDGRQDGIDAALELRQRFNVPTIFLTALDGDAERARAAPAGPLGWISKPVAATQLPLLIEELRSGPSK